MPPSRSGRSAPQVVLAGLGRDDGSDDAGSVTPGSRPRLPCGNSPIWEAPGDRTALVDNRRIHTWAHSGISPQGSADCNTGQARRRQDGLMTRSGVQVEPERAVSHAAAVTAQATKDQDTMRAWIFEQTVFRSRLILLAFLPLATSLLLAAGCSSQPTCPVGLHPYKDKCLTNMAIQYVGCTEGKGISPTTEVSVGVGGTLKVVADASLTLAYKKAQQENTPVALQIVKDCMEIAKTNSPPDDQEQSVATGYEQQWQKLVIGATASLTISPGSAQKGGHVTVKGSQFWPNEMVDIRVHATLVAQVPADANGEFSASITVPSSAPPPDFDTSITATGRSSARSAEAPFHTDP